jgi:hypothetical protein
MDVSPQLQPVMRTLDGHVEVVRALQADAWLLVHHLARRQDRSLEAGSAGSAAPAGGPTGGIAAIPDFRAEPAAKLLTRAPEQIAASPADLAALLRLVDGLTARVRPGNVCSIRLTCAYIGTTENGNLPASVQVEARRLGRWLGWIRCLGLLALAAAVMLLIHVASGQTILHELDQLSARREAALREIDATVDGQASAGSARGAAFCPEPRPAGWQPGSARQAALCGQLADLARKMDLTYQHLELWNTVSTRLAWVAPLYWLAANRGLVAGSDAEMRTTELRTRTALAALTGFVLPMLLGFLGACAYVHRQISNKIETWSLETRDRWQAALRVLLGLTLGGLVGALFGSDGVGLQGMQLSLSVISFGIGYAVQVVFIVLDAIIASISERLRGAFTGGARAAG